jgi:ubiquinone/menaquinone biosynthesis C-methylase UbiE
MSANSPADNREYYDAFAANYEARRGGRPGAGYHDLLDELESGFVERFGRGKAVLEVGCGTGLVLERIARFASSTRGIDLSPKMLEQARARGLEAAVADATALPFADQSFDVACSFKVLAHVRQVDVALAEMARVVRPGGFVIAEFYNPDSLRAWVKRLAPPGKIATGVDEAQVYTRFDSPAVARSRVPSGCRFVDSRGVRILVPGAVVMRVPLLKTAFRWAEHRLCDSRLSRFGGFWIAAYQKQCPAPSPVSE